MTVRLLVTIEDDDRCKHDAELYWKRFVDAQINTVGQKHKVQIAQFDELAHHHVDLDPPIHYYEPDQLGVEGLRLYIPYCEGVLKEPGLGERFVPIYQQRIVDAKARLQELTKNDKVPT